MERLCFSGFGFFILDSSQQIFFPSQATFSFFFAFFGGFEKKKVEELPVVTMSTSTESLSPWQKQIRHRRRMETGLDLLCAGLPSIMGSIIHYKGLGGRNIPFIASQWLAAGGFAIVASERYHRQTTLETRLNVQGTEIASGVIWTVGATRQLAMDNYTVWWTGQNAVHGLIMTTYFVGRFLYTWWYLPPANKA